MSTQQNRQIRELVDGLSQRPDRPMPTLRPEEPRGGIPSRRGYAERAYQPGSGVEGGVGIAGPLTEGATAAPVLARQFYPARRKQTSDGLFSFEMAALREITLYDANGRSVPVVLADPEG